MYTQGFGVAIVIGFVGLLTPALWLAWWLIADLGEKVSGKASIRPYARTDRDLRRAA